MSVRRFGSAALVGLGVAAFGLVPPRPASAVPARPGTSAATTEALYLSGTDKDATVDWEFQCTAGRRSGVWTTIPTPSNWELHGFGTFTYGWNPAPGERGLYRHVFTPPAAWRGRKVLIVFEGAMTDTEVWINGRSAGPVHQGGFYRFHYDVGGLVEYGRPNRLEVTVSKDSADPSVNRAERQSDYWVFGGIYRPVYLQAFPAEHVERVAIDARADGALTAEVHLGGIRTADRLVGRIRRRDGSPVGPPFSAAVVPGAAQATLATRTAEPLTWTAETPHLHELEVRLYSGRRVLHRTSERFGFRTIEVRPGDGIYVNGRRIVLKGTNRHSFWPDSGRATSPALSRSDVLLMKDMNMNAAVMSHYPPDAHFLDRADELGLYVIDELAGWQKAYDEDVGVRLVAETVVRDVNHPSVLFWANGNEGGWNPALDDDFARYDPQRRPVLHPWATWSGVDTDHYETYASTEKKLGGSSIFMPTEFLHGLYDGGAGAGLDDYWRLMTSRPRSAGGFLWALVDEGVVRGDRGGVVDVAGNLAPDGIVGPYRQREASFYTIRSIWAPIQLAEPDAAARFPEGFDGRLAIVNRYDFTNASRCRFEWELVDFALPSARRAGHTVAARGAVSGPSLAPGASGPLELRLPRGWRRFDALRVKVVDPSGRELDTWVFTIRKAAGHRDRIVAGAPSAAAAAATEDAEGITLSAGGTEIVVDKRTGRLAAVRHRGETRSLANGPALAVGAARLTRLSHRADGSSHVVEAHYEGELRSVSWRLLASGWLKLQYAYNLAGSHDYLGVGFDYPEARVKGVTWLGRGPHRVWKNRMRGPTTDVWSKDFNDTATGSRLWQYPEFKGYHANTYWAVLHTSEGDLTLVAGEEGLFLRLYTPRWGDDPRFTTAPFPGGDISFLDAIPPIGNKFHPAADTGPQGQPNAATGDYRRTIWLRFGD